MAIIDQINSRVPPAMKAEYDAIAAALEVPASQIFRRLLEEGLPKLRQEADETVAARGKWPHSIPAAAVEQEISDLMRAIAREEGLRVQPRELLSARGKAMLTLLSWIWHLEEEPSADEKKGRKKLDEWFASLNIKATVQASTPQPDAIQKYPRQSPR